ncbi:helix-turn-helix transcriptional regulator [Cupriavidus sp. SZY C1]|uniref:helix-turn-helix domain-containing protein n=1 Tax=Cupriavidus sp. SZY C1 TaxID=3055037 RepID=UPI0028B99A50|nr:helix-turn-helix transcriptional regulator [Cupriavidus sp. SZY C1]MDT6961298.1 helix-turn-helix transcriptional regulator [Cupriavidus sp. SZY C1]
MDTRQLMLPLQRQRKALGLTQQQLAAMAGLSRQSLNGIERGTVNVTLDNLCRLLDILGLSISISEPAPVAKSAARPDRALWMAARGANVSYAGNFTPAQLDQALATGVVPDGYIAHIAQVLDEAPLQLLVRAVAEVARKHGRKPAEIWKNVRSLARATTATRDGLWT